MKTLAFGRGFSLFPEPTDSNKYSVACWELWNCQIAAQNTPAADSPKPSHYRSASLIAKYLGWHLTPGCLVWLRNHIGHY
jgi:hypothetical protein